jgi:hypothetical protein
MTLQAGRNAIWLLCFIAAPAAHGLGKRFLRDFTVSLRPLVLCAVVPAAFLAIGVLQTPHQDGAGERVRGEAGRLAAGKPILADGIDAEQLALDGRRVWIANPLDAFSRRDQRRYLDWLDASPAGDALLREATAVVVTRGSAPQQRLERDRSFRRAAVDAKAVVYVRVTRTGDSARSDASLQGDRVLLRQCDANSSLQSQTVKSCACSSSTTRRCLQKR